MHTTNLSLFPITFWLTFIYAIFNNLQRKVKCVFTTNCMLIKKKNKEKEECTLPSKLWKTCSELSRVIMECLTYINNPQRSWVQTSCLLHNLTRKKFKRLLPVSWTRPSSRAKHRANWLAVRITFFVRSVFSAEIQFRKISSSKNLQLPFCWKCQWNSWSKVKGLSKRATGFNRWADFANWTSSWKIEILP